MKNSINRKRLIKRHNPVHKEIDVYSPFSIGNTDFACTVDITGTQSLYDLYNVVPLCCLSHWGWHSTPIDNYRDSYTLEDLKMTEYFLRNRLFIYPKKKFKENENVYNHLRENPHRLNLLRVKLQYNKENLDISNLSDIFQQLDLYTSTIESNFKYLGAACKVVTFSGNEKNNSGLDNDTLSFVLEGDFIKSNSLSIEVDFPYGSPDITASDWNSKSKHKTEIIRKDKNIIVLRRDIDTTTYFVKIQSNLSINPNLENHTVTLINSCKTESAYIFISLNPEMNDFSNNCSGLIDLNLHHKLSKEFWSSFWETGAAIQLEGSLDVRANELERRIILSQYLLALNSSGSAPPQETGLTCNSWYGKMHLEMYLWHSAWLALWGHGNLLEKSISWYSGHLLEAKINAKRNNYKGARWPKMVGLEAIDSPSPVAPLLIWQQPHIIYMLDMLYRSSMSSKDKARILQQYLPIIIETAEFMVDFAEYNEKDKCFELLPPVIPVQECHHELNTKNPIFEVAYWSFSLKLAIRWLQKLSLEVPEKWFDVSQNMAPLSKDFNFYLAHDNCDDTYENFNRDHPSMLGVFGLIDSNIDKNIMNNTLNKVLDSCDFTTMWGWDFALIAMCASRLDNPELALDVLLKDTEKNTYLTNGHNMQKTRKDLPLYLPGNGSLLIAIALMLQESRNPDQDYLGFPNNNRWNITAEGFTPLYMEGENV